MAVGAKTVSGALDTSVAVGFPRLELCLLVCHLPRGPNHCGPLRATALLAMHVPGEFCGGSNVHATGNGCYTMVGAILRL